MAIPNMQEQRSALATAYAEAYRQCVEARDQVDALTCGETVQNRRLLAERIVALTRARAALHLARKAAKAAGMTVAELTAIEIGDRPSHMLM